MPITHLLYLHGFRSSPQSTKARQVAEWMQKRHPDVTLWCPQLPPSPREAMAAVSEGIASWPRASMAVMGSSLGGFYASHVAETCGCKAVLLNPAVNPARDLSAYIGEQTTWHDLNERFFFEPRFVDELRELTRSPVAEPDGANVGAQYFALIAKGDEVLDWREMTARYPGARIRLLEGGDHAISDFNTHLPEVMDFLGLA